MLLLMHRGPWLALLLALFSCHDAPRTNPFDPALTPAVELQVALDDTAGTATLTWTRYEGQQPFQEYRVLRNITDRKSVDTLAHLSAVEQTSFADTALEPNTAYVYRVAVVNTAGYETPSEEKSVTGFSVGAVRLLEVKNDQDSGGLALSWNRYVGPDFASYQVRRRQVGTDREETLAEVAVPTDTSFADQTAQAGVEYVYTVVVAAAGQTLLSNTQEATLTLPPVEIMQADFNSAEASASLTWTRYQGPRFKAYQVWHRTEELAAQVIAEKADIADTSLVDTDLLGNTEYFYQVVVETERDEQVMSEEKRGIFHELLATWLIEATGRPLVRLYREGEGVAALIFYRNPPGVPSEFKLLLFDAEGRFQEKHLLDFYGHQIDSQRCTALASSLDGRRLLSVVSSLSSREVGILSWEADGQQIVRELSLFGDAFPQPFTGPEGVVAGEIALLGNGVYDNVAVSAQGRLLFSEGFEGKRTAEGWDLGEGELSSSGVLFGDTQIGVAARRADGSWQDFRLEADLVGIDIYDYRTGPQGIQIGGGTFSRLALWLDMENQQAVLDWSFTPPSDLDLEPRAQRSTASMGVLGVGTYRLGLEVVGGQVRASVKTPLLWGGVKSQGLPWTALASFGKTLALTVDDQPYAITPEGEAITFANFPNGVSELRAWTDRRGRQQGGICIPEAGQLLLGIVPEGEDSQWPTYLSRALGPTISEQQGLLSYPISFDVGPDGRIYVLDAGSGRILVFDSSRQYLTQWGRRGNGEGEFNFGRGFSLQGGGLDFAGSIAVDSQGFIYVADEINKRIQKFAP